MFPRILMG